MSERGEGRLGGPLRKLAGATLLGAAGLVGYKAAAVPHHLPLPPAVEGEEAGAGDLDNVPELGLSEDVFAAETPAMLDEEPVNIEDAVILDGAEDLPVESPDEDKEQE